MNKNELKAELIKIRDNNWNFKDVKIYEDMIDSIGDLEPMLRDELIYIAFCEMMEKNILKDEEKNEILDRVLHLIFCGIEEKGDLIYTRTFSVLIVALMVAYDDEDDFIQKEKFDKTVDLLISYINKEKDLRGFTGENGWAHALAHSADAVYACVENKKSSSQQETLLINTLIDKIACTYYVFAHNEDERVVSPIIYLIEKKVIDVDYVISRFKSTKPDNEYEKYILDANKKLFFRSLYFRLKNIGYEDLLTLEKEIKNISPYFYEN